MSTVEEDEQDLTRKQRREQARSERKAMEEAEAANAAAAQAPDPARLGRRRGRRDHRRDHRRDERRRRHETAAEQRQAPNKYQAVEKVDKELGGIPQNGNTLGNPKAPVTMVYFGDLECPICKDFTLGALPTLIQKYVRTGKLRIEYRNLETATREPETFRTQQVAALAAGKQNKGWYYIELFYNQQGEEDTEYVTEQYLRTLAEQTPGPEPGQLDGRAQRTGVHEHDHQRRAGGEQRRLHRHAVVPDRQDGRPGAEARIPVADRSVGLRIGDQQAAVERDGDERAHAEDHDDRPHDARPGGRVAT